MTHRLALLPALLFLACAHTPSAVTPSVHVELHSEAGWDLRCGSEWIYAEGNDVLLARVMRVLDGHPEECTGDVCVVHGVSMRAMEHAINGIDENSVERDGHGVVRIVARDAR